MSEVQYIWADPASASQQVALSSIAQAMEKKQVMAIARWVNKDGADPKMGVLSPSIFENVDCLLWVQVWLGFFYPVSILCSPGSLFGTEYCNADAFRGRRSQIHIRITRQPHEQKGQGRYRASMHSHRRTARSNGQICRCHGPDACW